MSSFYSSYSDSHFLQLNQWTDRSSPYLARDPLRTIRLTILNFLRRPTGFSPVGSWNYNKDKEDQPRNTKQPDKIVLLGGQIELSGVQTPYLRPQFLKYCNKNVTRLSTRSPPGSLPMTRTQAQLTMQFYYTFICISCHQLTKTYFPWYVLWKWVIRCPVLVLSIGALMFWSNESSFTSSSVLNEELPIK